MGSARCAVSGHIQLHHIGLNPPVQFAAIIPEDRRFLPMRMSDYDAVLRIWRKTEGLCVVEEDSRNGIKLYLSRNKGLCFVALVGKRLVGTVLSGHDGRRAILRHLAVVRSQRRKGIGRALVERSLAALAAQGVTKCNLYVMKGHRAGLKYWEGLGYQRLEDDYWTLQRGTGALEA
jgi:ribosomal protein S18 acetylase RimI-like enzyme